MRSLQGSASSPHEGLEQRPHPMMQKDMGPHLVWTVHEVCVSHRIPHAWEQGEEADTRIIQKKRVTNLGTKKRVPNKA